MKAEIWSDLVCPWCYLGTVRFLAALNRFGHADDVTVVYRSFELHAGGPGNGRTDVTDAFAAREGVGRAEVATMFGRVSALAAREGLHYDLGHAIPADTFDAHRLLHIAADHGRQHDMVRALFEAHLCRAQDLGDTGTLVALGASVGLAPDEVRRGLASGRGATRVRADRAQAERYGISAVPFFVLDGRYGISGAQSTKVFVQALEQIWSETRPSRIEAVPAETGGTRSRTASRPEPSAV